ncbi:hypothetical protein ACGFZS_32430 [Streptomyces sp. NPDC048288]|uniref:hypothetical protein n=1 Tax=Streptomyces sp. NPDC048288 TaxID=3365529 RepID=UPI003716627A
MDSADREDTVGSRRHPAAAAALFAVAGSVMALLAGAPAATALPVGAGVGGLVWAAHAITGRLTRPAPSASARPTSSRTDAQGADRPTDAPPADAARWLTRATAAADRLQRQCRQSPIIGHRRSALTLQQKIGRPIDVVRRKNGRYPLNE